MNQRFLLLLCSFVLLLCTCASAQRVTQTFGPDFYTNIDDADIAAGGNGWAVGVCNIFLKTSDGGETWTDVSEDFDISSVRYVSCLPGTNCETVFMSGNFPEIMASFDGGNNWEMITGTSRFTRVDHPFPGLILAYSTRLDKIGKSTDGGRTWSYAASGTDLESGLAVLSENEYGYFTDKYYYLTTDGGQTFVQGDSLDQSASLITVTNDGNLLAVDRYTKLWRSTDKGVTWTIHNERIFQYTVHNALWQDADDVLHYITFLGIHVTSADGGLTWERISTSPRLWSANHYKLIPNSVLALGDDNSLHKFDYATGVYDYLLGEVHPDFQALDFSPDGKTGFIVTRDNLVYRSDDGGRNWAYVSTPDLQGDPEQLVVRSAEQIFLLTQYSGLTVSNDGGVTFTELPTGNELRTFNGGILKPIGDDFFLLDQNSFGRVTADGTVLYVNDIDRSAIHDVYFLNELKGFGYGRKTLMVTLDGGVTWNAPTVNGDLESSPSDMVFTDDQHGFLLSFPSFATTDGGATWNEAPDFWKRGDAMTTSITGDTIYVHERGSIYQSTNAMATEWELVTSLGCGRALKLMRRPGTSELFAMETSGIALIDLEATPVGVEKVVLAAKPLKIFPNPTTGLASVALPASLRGEALVEVYSATGQQIVGQSVMVASERMNLDLSAVPAGIYLVRMTDGQVMHTGRVVVR
ncbi:T9SS type A sorting domain-containing protein [Neolewinella persica]|uniref:T9SS type A sorting domain-containing protein n=1 Tax=Neolewinella persica TaxID=70998 RepID=UPI000380BBD6|nr:YCF48-related protein [Neolewinella persica]